MNEGRLSRSLEICEKRCRLLIAISHEDKTILVCREGKALDRPNVEIQAHSNGISGDQHVEARSLFVEDSRLGGPCLGGKGAIDHAALVTEQDVERQRGRCYRGRLGANRGTGRAMCDSSA